MIKTKEEYAKELQGQTLSKPEALWYFGNEGEIRNFFKGKKNAFSGSTAKTFKTTLEQYFETVDDTVKVGKGKGYKLGAAKENKSELHRELGKNATNGKWNGSTKHLDALLLSHLEHNLINGKEIQKSYINWLLEFKMINEKQYELYQSKFNKNIREGIDEIIREAVENKDERIVSSSHKFFMDDIQAQRTTMLSSLKRMEREGIIETFKRHKAYLNKPIKNTKGKEVRVISIDSKTYQSYINAKRRFKEEYNLSESDVTYRTYQPSKKTLENVKKYKDKIKDFLSKIEVTDSYGTKITVSISNIWEELAIVVKATRSKTMDYLNKFHHEILVEYQIHKYERFLSNRALEYRGNRTEERLEKAEGRREKHISDSKDKDDKHNSNLSFGTESFNYTEDSLKTKEVFMKAIEKLDNIFGDDFIIDENKIEAALKIKK